jgi:hypothetical protein
MKRLLVLVICVLTVSVTDAQISRKLKVIVGAASASNPGIGNLFNTTYNCAVDTTYPVACGSGVASYGSWTTSNGNPEQIVLAANYSLGAGSNGQRHWNGQASGNTNGSGGIAISGFGTQQELYIRWYVRWESGVKLGGDTAPILREHKIVYFVGSACGNGAGGCYWNIRASSFDFAVAGNPYSGTGGGWDGAQMFNASNASSDGRWIRMEVHMVNETGGLNNGVAQWWIDGVLVLNHTDIDFNSTGFDSFVIPENGQFTVANPAVDMYEDFDDIAVGTVGPIGAY